MTRGWPSLTGSAALTLVAASTLAAPAALVFFGGLSMPDKAVLEAVRFTTLQATISAAVSCALAIPVARALFRQRFPGRTIVILCLGAPFLMPAIVAVLAILAVFGRNGPVNALLEAVRLPGFEIYGLHGVVIAHVFLNLPLATRLLLDGWASIPSERFRTAASLGFGPADVSRLIERPMLRERLPAAFLTVFLICLTSFAVALTLGGGPRATTVELAIYQAFRFDFDPGRAAILSLMQIALCLAAGIAVLSWGVPGGFGAGRGREGDVGFGPGPAGRAADFIAIGLASVFLAAPVLALLSKGLPVVAVLPAPVWEAAARSLVIALLASAICTALALSVAILLVRLPTSLSRVGEVLGLLPIVVSPLVLGTAAFLLLRPYVAPQELALPVTLFANVLLSLPFALRIVLPAVRASESGFGRLADSLGFSAGTRLFRLTLPQTSRSLGFAAGLTAAFSMGDLGAIALFADPASATLPYQLSLLMGSYRMQDAHGAAVLLVVLGLAMFAILERGGKALART